eukprot:Plantae.Rhodophyta-Palmaria_palmata.ctg33764.p1 GENE.Plantae.Rhodophyta-Palmaria_palmata.ctg33764~~Plantae.Rhodophyta-Palmaria_palmata.ctg33764.p1  ORF type:complete len:113 (+),score=16.29 Plantae.Rhodophyta-Palmaria_palmata.ctg33764:170-508(+)
MAWQSRLAASLHELRVVYCASSVSSAGTREFIKKNYSELKKLNPTLPIYLRPCDGAEPHIAARYDRGVYSAQDTADMSSDKVLGVLESMVSQAPEVNSQFGKGGLGVGAFSK